MTEDIIYENTAEVPQEDIAEEIKATTAIPEPNEKESLLAEIAALRAQIAEREQEQQAILKELGEFNRLFPDISVRALPKRVREQVEGGIPLCAAYALYEKEESLLRSKADSANAKNTFMSAGRAGRNTEAEYFSPDEVRAMSQKEVHENYSKIRNSMKYWH